MSLYVSTESETETLTRFDQLIRPPVFVVGAARSGTTWVYDILTVSDAVAGIYESWFFSDSSGLGTLFGKAHRAGIASGLSNVLDRETLVEHVRQFAMQVMSHAIEPHHQFLVEKSPSHIYTIPLIKRVFPTARFVHVLRDGRDVSVSVRAATRSWAREWKSSHGRSVATSANRTCRTLDIGVPPLHERFSARPR